jgi:hypothetical protein
VCLAVVEADAPPVAVNVPRRPGPRGHGAFVPAVIAKEAGDARARRIPRRRGGTIRRPAVVRTARSDVKSCFRCCSSGNVHAPTTGPRVREIVTAGYLHKSSTRIIYAGEDYLSSNLRHENLDGGAEDDCRDAVQEERQRGVCAGPSPCSPPRERQACQHGAGSAQDHSPAGRAHKHPDATSASRRAGLLGRCECTPVSNPERTAWHALCYVGLAAAGSVVLVLF